MKRTDVHAPSRIVPSDYNFVVVRTREDDELGFAGDAVKEFNNHRAVTGGKFSGHDHGGSCNVCGAWMIDYAIFHHTPSNVYIKTGLDCAAKIDDGHEDDFRRVAQIRRAAAKRVAAVESACETLESLGLLDYTETLFEGAVGGIVMYSTEDHGYMRLLGAEPSDVFDTNYRLFTGKLWTYIDMVRNLVKYSSWSDKQIKFAKSIVAELSDVPTVIATRKAEHESALDAPEGKVEITAVVISVNRYDNWYNGGIDTKMMVKHDGGFKVFVTVPSKLINDIAIGDTVSFVATLTRSDKDSKFAFGKRPSKAKIISKAEIK